MTSHTLLDGPLEFIVIIILLVVLIVVVVVNVAAVVIGLVCWEVRLIIKLVHLFVLISWFGQARHPRLVVAAAVPALSIMNHMRHMSLRTTY